MKDQYRNSFLDDVWNIGINGILDNKINGLKMKDTLSRATKWVIAGAEATAIVLLGSSCDTLPPVVAAENPNNNYTPTETTPTATPEVAKINSAEIVVITNESYIQKTVDDLPVNKPQIKDDTKYEVFDIRVGFRNFRTVMYQIAEEEVNKQPVIETTDSMGNKVASVQNVAAFTQFVDVDGKPSWVRLFATNQGSTDTIFNTTWFYDPKGFPTADFQVVDVTRSVLGYSYNVKENKLFNLTVQPLYVDPMYIPNFNYTDAIDEVIIKGDEPSTMKVQASRDRISGPSPEFIDLKIINSVEFPGTQNGISTNIELMLDESMIFKGVDNIVKNEKFPGGADAAMAKYTQQFYFEVAKGTNKNAENLTFEEYVEAWKTYQDNPEDKDAKSKIEFTFFNDATNQMETRVPMDLKFVFGSANKLEGLRTNFENHIDGIRIEYDASKNELRYIDGYGEVYEPTAYKHFGADLAKAAKYLIKYKGVPLTNFNYTNISEILRGLFVADNGIVAFKIEKNGEPASDTEAQQNY